MCGEPALRFLQVFPQHDYSIHADSHAQQNAYHTRVSCLSYRSNPNSWLQAVVQGDGKPRHPHSACSTLGPAPGGSTRGESSEFPVVSVSAPAPGNMQVPRFRVADVHTGHPQHRHIALRTQRIQQHSRLGGSKLSAELSLMFIAAPSQSIGEIWLWRDKVINPQQRPSPKLDDQMISRLCSF